MKYFKITNLTTDETHYISSDLTTESPEHVAMSAHLDPGYQWAVEEISYGEFNDEIEKVFTEGV